MNKIINIVLWFCVCLLLLPTTVYATEIEETEEIIEEGIEVLIADYPLELDTTFKESDLECVEFLDNLNDFYVSVCLKEAWDSGCITEDTGNIFIYVDSGDSYSYCPKVYIYYTGLSILDNREYIYINRSSFREYDTGKIFKENFSGKSYSHASSNDYIAKYSIADTANTFPFRYYSNFDLGDKTLRELPEPMSVSEAYEYYFKKSDDTTNITFIDFTETNKILNNIFVTIVFVVIYGWFLNPLFKIFNNIVKENK